MSGGSLDYVYSKLEDAISRISGDGRPLHRAFANHLKLVAKALHDVEWEYSCDYGKGDADEAIKAVFGKQADAEIMKAIAKDLKPLVGQAQEILRRTGERATWEEGRMSALPNVVLPSSSVTNWNYNALNVAFRLEDERESRKLSATLTPVILDQTWVQYLNGLVSRGIASTEQIQAILKLWNDASARMGSPVPLPITQPASENSIQLAWDNGLYYLEVEVYPNASMHWFFRDRRTDELAGTDDQSIEAAPSEFYEKLKLLIPRV